MPLIDSTLCLFIFAPICVLHQYRCNCDTKRVKFLHKVLSNLMNVWFGRNSWKYHVWVKRIIQLFLLYRIFLNNSFVTVFFAILIKQNSSPYSIIFQHYKMKHNKRKHHHTAIYIYIYIPLFIKNCRDWFNFYYIGGKFGFTKPNS